MNLTQVFASQSMGTFDGVDLNAFNEKSTDFQYLKSHQMKDIYSMDVYKIK